ncbi:MAG: P-loop NTPase [Bacillota bacterium]|nr:P-loop NTPase [Bacillota bacterium]
MSYLECPGCKKLINVFGASDIEEVTKGIGVDLLGKLPIDPEMAELCDEGRLEVYGAINGSMKDIVDRIEGKLGGER